MLGIGIVLLLSGSTRFADSPWMLAAVLVGVAIALWQPRGTDALVVEAPSATQAASDSGAARRGWSRPRRRPSVLGRITLGVAILVAAVGALIDQANGGRLHPEQWLGAAAAVCGAGIFVSAWRGRAMWLILPAVAFGVSGFVAGHAARAGVDEFSWGTTYEAVGPGWSTGPREVERVAGEVNLDVAGVPDDTPQAVDVRIGIGELRTTVADGVTVELRADLEDGTAFVDGDRVAADEPIRVGPEGSPDVIVTVTISEGDLFVARRPTVFVDRPTVPPVPAVPPLAIPDGEPVLDLGDGLMMASDGTVLLPDGTGAIGPEGQLWITGGQLDQRGNGVTAIITPIGDEYLLLPNLIIVTPQGTLIDVPARRVELSRGG